MKKYSLSRTLCPDEVDRLKQYPHGRVMQDHEEPAYQLVQKINLVIANTATTLILQEIAQLLGIAFKVDCCLVTLMGDDLEAISANWCAQEYSGLLQPDELFSVEQFDLSVVPSGFEPLTIEEISTIENSIVVLRQSLSVPIKSVVAISTRFAGKNNGVISLIKSHFYDWSEEEKKQLKAVESSCALAFSQVMQAQLITTQQQHLLTCNQHQSLIKQLTILSRSNLEINQMLQLAIASCAEALQADRGLLVLLKYTNPLFRNRPRQQVPNARATIVGQWLKDDSYISQQDVLEQSFLISECSLCQRLFKDSVRQIIINNSVDQDPSTAAPVFALSSLPAVLLMPLESQGKILGFLVLQQAEYRSWTAAELNIVEMVSAQMSNAIIQTQTLRQVQTLVDERTNQLQRSLEVQAKLYEKQKQYVGQLQILNQLKDDFLSNMSDRLRYPLTNMRMALRNLRQPGINSERQTRYLNILDDECTKEINLINDLLTLQRLETQPERPQFATVDLNEKIKHLAASFEKKLADKGLKISLDLPPTSQLIQTEVESFDRILQELLTNTCKYSEPDTTVKLQVKHQNEQIPQVIIKVINVGRGISVEEATYIFDKFRRGKGRWTPGTGLGLALVKSLVQHLNGEITVESIPIENKSESNICFTLNLPQFSDESKTPN